MTEMFRKYTATLAESRPVLDVGLGLIILVFGAIASVAAVRHSLHHDASSHSASCLVCSFTAGQVEAPEGACIVPLPAEAVDVAPFPVTSLLLQNPSFLLPLGRAPPILAVVS